MSTDLRQGVKNEGGKNITSLLLLSISPQVYGWEKGSSTEAAAAALAICSILSYGVCSRSSRRLMLERDGQEGEPLRVEKRNFLIIPLVVGVCVVAVSAAAVN